MIDVPTKNAVYAAAVRRARGIDDSSLTILYVLASERQAVLAEIIGRNIMDEPLWTPSRNGSGITYRTTDAYVLMWRLGELNIDILPSELTRPTQQLTEGVMV